MSSSKLPKPHAASKLPQTRILRPLATIPEIVLKVHEAPANSTAEKRGALRRRSKSANDLRVVVKPITSTVGPMSSKGIQNIASVGPKVEQPKKVTQKRPLVTKSDDGAPKPKVAKKIPNWDFKSRFNQINEKYQVSQNIISEMQPKVAEYGHMQQTVNTLLKQIEDIQEKSRTDLEKIKLLEAENCAQSQQITQLTSSQETLQRSHDTLSCDLKDITTKQKAVSKKYDATIEENTKLLDMLEASQKENNRLSLLVSTLENELQISDGLRRKLHNSIQDLKGNIRIFCRVRPPRPSEEDKLMCSISFLDDEKFEICKSTENVSQISGRSRDCKAEFRFEKVFAPESTQGEIFEELAQLVQSALDGYHVCVFAYGQTGSGKTHTMQGGEGTQQGMVPRTINLIFDRMVELQKHGLEYSVEASFMEVYNENIRDLLNMNSGQKLDIHFNAGRGTTVTNLTQQPISSAAELTKYMRRAHSNRATAATNIHEHSSRSHAVTKIYLEGTTKNRTTVYSGSINLVDLAGSESAKQALGDRLTETKNINRSLSALRDVVCALHNKAEHVPYRNSKLTYLLQSCLGGDSKTLMIVNVAPLEDCFGESISSLRFATAVKEVKTSSKKNKKNF